MKTGGTRGQSLPKTPRHKHPSTRREISLRRRRFKRVSKWMKLSDHTRDKGQTHYVTDLPQQTLICLGRNSATSGVPHFESASPEPGCADLDLSRLMLTPPHARKNDTTHWPLEPSPLSRSRSMAPEQPV